MGKSKDDLIQELTRYIKINGYPTSKRNDFKPKNNLSGAKVFKNVLGGDLADWIEMCGFTLSEDEKYKIKHRGKPLGLTKDECIDIIFEMQSKLKRPLEYDDFRNPLHGEIGITTVKRYWGSVNRMKAELGLEIIQESMMDKQLSKDDFDNMINDIVNYLNEDNRDFITTREIDDNSSWASYGTLDRMSKKYYNTNLVSHLSTFSIRFGKQGRGFNYDFSDGEHTTSQYEYLFSKYLKDNGFEYNKSYFRDVKYRDFIPNYNGIMNCDYVINIENGQLYIEIAGIIADYKTWYYQDKIIAQSKSKEEYRLKLKEKEKMLQNTGLTYLILFPCDLTKENFKKILFDFNSDIKYNIENFYKNNIDWKKVREIGGLDYSQDVIRKEFKRINKTA